MKKLIQKIKICIQSNGGFTLIELLVATAILGIVSAPLLHNFLISANTELKGRKRGELTAIAQNIMESIKSNDFDDIIPATLPSSYDLFGLDTIVDYYTEEKNNNTSVFVKKGKERPDGNDYFLGIQELSVGGQKYNALIEISPLLYNGSLNKWMLSDYSSMDAVFQVPKNETEGNRTITMDVEQEIVDTKSYIKITVQYAVAPSPAGTPQVMSASETLSYEVIGGKMPSVYLLFYPNYKGEDKIVINNKQDLVLDLFMVKQLDATLLSNFTTLHLNEQNYKCKVEQHLSAHDKKGATIYSNLNEAFCPWDVNNTADHTPITGNIEYWIYDANNLYIVKNEFGDLEDDKDTPNAVVSESVEERVYEVRVKIFAQDDVEFKVPLHTVRGTKLK